MNVWRQVLLVVVLVFLAAAMFATVQIVVEEGLTPIVVLSVLVIALFAFGIVGALLNPPDDRGGPR